VQSGAVPHNVPMKSWHRACFIVRRCTQRRAFFGPSASAAGLTPPQIRGNCYELTPLRYAPSRVMIVEAGQPARPTPRTQNGGAP